MSGVQDDNTSKTRGSDDGRPRATEAALPQWTVTVRPDATRPADDPQPPAREVLSDEPAERRVPAPVHRQPEEARKRRFGAAGFVALALGALGLLALGAVGYAALIRDDGAGDTALASEVTTSTADAPIEDIQLLLQGVGYEGIEVTEQDGTIYLSGAVETQADIAAVITASVSQADGFPINTDAVTVASPDPAAPGTPTTAGPTSSAGQSDPLQRLQLVLNRTVAARPIIFEPGTSGIASWHSGALDQVADILLANPGIAVAVVGYTDDSGSARENQAISEERAGAVRDYLVGKGLDPGLVKIDARGESEATGIRDVGYLERRVEFEVVAVSLTPPVPLPLDVGIIVPSARDDLAFSQSLVDALNVLDEERGGLSLEISENMFDVDQAAEQARAYAESGSDVVILHGAQFLPLVEALALESPEVVFVAGPDPLETDLPNVFVYTVAAQQGAYVLGDLAASLSGSDTIGIIGPVPASEPARFVEGFRLGAERQGATVLSEYVGSFNDTEAAAAVAESHVEAGADVLTGTSQLTVGPIDVAARENLLWFANQANQTSLAPDNVVASQVYHFEVAIREILAEIDADSTTGGSFPLTLGNGGMLLEFNPDYPLDSDLRRRADNLLFEVTAGSVTVDIEE